MHALGAHLTNETRLLLRDPAALIFGAVAPLIAVIVMSFIPGAREPLAEMGGTSVLDTYRPVLVLFSSSILGLTVIPGILGNYREMGVLRRLRTTPTSPSSLLAALFILITVAAVMVASLIILIPGLSGAGWPRHVAWFVLAAFLATTAFVAMGTVLAAVVPNAKAAPGIGNFFAMLMWAAAGMWYPRALFPDWLRAVADLTPGGAAAEAMLRASGGVPQLWAPYAVLAGWTVVCALLAARVFRWE